MSDDSSTTTPGPPAPDVLCPTLTSPPPTMAPRATCSSSSSLDDLKCTSFNFTELPLELRFNEHQMVFIIAYCFLFVIGAIGNVSVFLNLIRGRHRKSRITLMITHLSIADLFVTFIMIPLEIGWRLTIQWLAGNVACKLFLFFRAFGLYLSSNVLICVSIDRYFAILHPLRNNNARRRGKYMLTVAWILAFICALPQSIVFHVSEHPTYKGFRQCVSFGFFRNQSEETSYNLFCVFAMYFVPLTVIVFSYSCILWKVCKKWRESRDNDGVEENEGDRLRGRLRLRRSDRSSIERARAKTLRMTAYIVAAFVWCWTPYVLMTLWYMIDRESARTVNMKIQDGLFLMAVSNSCVNPLVYGSHTMNLKGGWKYNFRWLFRRHRRLQRRSTDGVGRTNAVQFVPRCVITLFKGSGATRSTHVPPLRNLDHNRNELIINRRTARPAEQLMRRGRYESGEFHSDPGAHCSNRVVS